MNGFLKKILLLSSPFLIMIILNCLIDNANILSGGIEEKAANIILKGKNIANLIIYDERLFQKKIIQGGRNADLIILGSSRSMQMGSQNFSEELKVYNYSVSSAVLQDFFAIYHLLESSKNIPKTIIIGVDPWILIKKIIGEIRWASINLDYKILAKKLELTPIPVLSGGYNSNKIKELLNPEYLLGEFDFVFFLMIMKELLLHLILLQM